MAFQVSAAPTETFDFKLPGSKKIYKLPLLQNLPMALRNKTRRSIVVAERIQRMEERGKKIELTQDEANILLDAQEALLDTYHPGLSEKITDAQFQEIMKAWGEASKVTVGESSASSD